MNKFIITPRYYWNKQAINKYAEMILKVILALLITGSIYFLFTKY